MVLYGYMTINGKYGNITLYWQDMVRMVGRGR